MCANPRTSVGLPQRSLRIPLHLGFALTGIGTVLLGAILPRASVQWHLRDKDAGLLLLVQFAASASGALLTRRQFWKTLACGYLLSASAAMCIFLLRQGPFSLLLLAFACLGLGLGLAMTATNLLIPRLYPHRKGAALALLNFSWSAGAVACPLLAGRAFSQTPGGTLFGLTGLLLFPFAFLPMAARMAKVPAARAAAPRLETGPAEVPAITYFALLAFLYVGVETTVSNWISTYATRVAPSNLTGSSMVVAIFWAALLLGRGMTPFFLNLLSEQRLYQSAAALVIGGVVVLLSAHSAGLLFVGTAVCGLTLAPLFPLTISLLLAEIGESQNGGWVFAFAGLGGATFSWLTGFVSTSAGSLRVGLLVPAASSLCMTALIAWRKPGNSFA